MVHKIIWTLLVSFTVQAATPGLHLHWMGSKDKPCQKLIETFLVELRSMAADRIIELEAMGEAHEKSTSPEIDIRCVGNAVEARQGEDKLLLHYLAKASGFDANDWLPFQQKYLRPDLSLPDPTKMEPQEAISRYQMATADPTAEHHSLLQHWWFWALVGGVGASVYGVVRATSNQSGRVNVEIH